MVKIFKKSISWLLIIMLTMPLLAQGRAGAHFGGGGGRSSFGGYHSRSYQGGGYNYRPSSTYRPRPTYNDQRSYATPQPRASSGSFFSGLFTGILGGYLYNKLFSSEPAHPVATNSTATPSDKTTNNLPTATHQQSGGFFKLILLLLAVFFIWKIFKKRRAGTNNQNFLNQDSNQPKSMPPQDYRNLAPGFGAPTLQLTPNDQQEFERLLINIQDAWSNYNLAVLQRFTTPDMFEDFSKIIQENEQKGIANHVSDVKLTNQVLQESWQEGEAILATVALTWDAIDYAYNKSLSANDNEYLIDGNMHTPTTVSEIWTFRKENQISPWLLDQIQQT